MQTDRQCVLFSEMAVHLSPFNSIIVDFPIPIGAVRLIPYYPLPVYLHQRWPTDRFANCSSPRQLDNKDTFVSGSVFHIVCTECIGRPTDPHTFLVSWLCPRSVQWCDEEDPHWPTAHATGPVGIFTP
ncbi:unnamed protein product [Protopolystoma xenopodis]|uniref:Uncharacterized protein n=1 Tax=Protopolystoma xenopodis TaxID=117903 RepID=A0A3S5FEI8_9PLAT|nr:unnamed protein product [Protopolystoma xenopodis]